MLTLNSAKRDISVFWLDDVDHRREYTQELLNEQLNRSGWQIKEMVHGNDLRAPAVSTHFCNKEQTID